MFLDLQEIVANSRTRAVPRLALAASGLAKLAALDRIPGVPIRRSAGRRLTATVTQTRQMNETPRFRA